MNQNINQIILNEGTNIIEVLIFSKQHCDTWNKGRGIIGIQNAARTRGLMAPGRRASDPPWGEGVMNEGWQFVPSQGQSSLMSIDLKTTGGFLADRIFPGSAGLQTQPDGTLLATFTNFCPPPGAMTEYRIESHYKKFDDPSQEIVGVDTVRVNRSGSLDLGGTAISTASVCGTIGTGTITASVPPGTGTRQIRYSLTGGSSFQNSGIFNNVAAGNYTVLAQDEGGCSSSIPVTVANNGVLAATVITKPASCFGGNDAAITVTISNAAPGTYTYTLNGTTVVSAGATATFSNLSRQANNTITVSTAGIAKMIK
ncbi:MAG: hypothetical protein EOO88_63090, partial [Pedobacter sp.]